MLSLFPPLLSVLLMLQCQSSYLFLSLGAQLYIPSQHYSLLTINYSIAKIQNKLFDIGIELSLNQVNDPTFRLQSSTKLILFLIFWDATIASSKNLSLAMSKITLLLTIDTPSMSLAMSNLKAYIESVS